MLRRLAASVFTAAALVTGSALAVVAQVETPYQNREERQLYNNSGAGNDGGSILDASNPMDLINRIRQAGAMDDATPPSDAIDAALKAYQKEPSPSPAQP